MQARSFEEFLKANSNSTLPVGAVAIIFLEDEIGVGSCIRHHARLGFRNILLIGAETVSLPEDCEPLCHRITSEIQLHLAVNLAIEAYPGRWIYYCYTRSHWNSDKGVD